MIVFDAGKVELFCVFFCVLGCFLALLSGLVPLDVVMVVRPDGRGAGEAIVVLPNHMEMQMALSRDKQHMGRRCVRWRHVGCSVRLRSRLRLLGRSRRC